MSQRNSNKAKTTILETQGFKGSVGIQSHVYPLLFVDSILTMKTFKLLGRVRIPGTDLVNTRWWTAKSVCGGPIFVYKKMFKYVYRRASDSHTPYKLPFFSVNAKKSHFFFYVKGCI